MNIDYLRRVNVKFNYQLLQASNTSLVAQRERLTTRHLGIRQAVILEDFISIG